MESKKIRVAFVGCTKTKHDTAMPARELFSKSGFFQLMRTYVETHDYDAWFILSTRYGLVAPSEVIEPYELALSAKELIKWSKGVAKQIAELVARQAWAPEKCHFDFFVSYKTAKVLVPLVREELGYELEIDRPIAGRGRIGQIMEWLQGSVVEKLRQER